MKYAEYGTAKSAFDDGSIWSSSDDELKQCAAMLSTQFIKNENIRQNVGIMAGMISDELTRRFMNRLDSENQKTQFWFKILAIGSLVISAIQLAVELCKSGP